MKLPFKIPSIKFPKFGKKKTDDDDDDDDFDFDPSDFEGDDQAPSGVGESEADGEGGAQADDAGDEAAPAPEQAIDADAPAKPEGGDAGTDQAADSASDQQDDASQELEDIDFGDDDDDDDQEGGDKAKRKKLMIAGGGVAALLLIGGVTWFLMSGGEQDPHTAKPETGIPMVSMDIAPKKKKLSGNSLNAIAAGAKGPGLGITVAVVSPAAFSAIPAPAVTDAPLLESNDPALSENSPQGPLPIIAEDGRMVWQVYAKPFNNQDARPRVAIVISGLGLSETATRAAIELLPGNVTLAFSPYAPGLPDWVAKARQAGHEAMIMVPLEPQGFPLIDPGPQTQMTTNAPEENSLRLEYVLSRTTGYIGVMSVMGSKFNTSEPHVRTFLEALKSRGLMFLEGAVGGQSLAPKIATEIGLPRALTNIVLDQIPTREAIDDQLVELEDLLAQQPAAVVIAEAYPASIERLAVWSAALESKNLVLAPLSALADKQFLE